MNKGVNIYLRFFLLKLPFNTIVVFFVFAILENSKLEEGWI